MLYIGAVRLQVEPMLTAGAVIATIQLCCAHHERAFNHEWTFAFWPHLKVCIQRIAEVLALKGVEARASKRFA
jgi:hypothetical protein